MLSLLKFLREKNSLFRSQNIVNSHKILFYSTINLNKQRKVPIEPKLIIKMTYSNEIMHGSQYYKIIIGIKIDSIVLEALQINRKKAL